MTDYYSKANAPGKSPRKGLFYGWWVLTALFFIGMFGPMGRYALTALAPFMSNELLVSKSQIGMAFSIHFWTYSFLVLLIGWLMDRIGSRRVMFLGGIILLTALALLSRVSALWQLYLTFGVITPLGVSMTHYVPCQATSRKWFVKRAGLAAGITSDAFAIGSSIMTPVLTGVADSLGWRTVWLICALAFGITIMLLAGLVIRDTPESMGLHPDGKDEAPQAYIINSSMAQETTRSPKEALRTSPFWLLFFASSLSGFPGQGMLTQVIMWGVNLGEPMATAGIFMTAIALPSVVTRVLGGWLGDRYGKRRMIVISYFIVLVVMLGGWLTVNSTNSLMIIAALFGMVYGIPTALFPAYLGDLYGRSSLGMLVGIMTFGTTFIGGFSPLIWGRIADATGNYNLACLISAIIYAVGVVALILIKPEKLARSC